MPTKLLHTVIVHPSRYDEEGLMVFRRGIGHNGTLSLLSGLIDDFNRRDVDVHVVHRIFDEHVMGAVTRKRLRAWQAEARRAGATFVLMIAGIHTSSYPRGRDVALLARSEGVTTIAGGIHLSCHGPSVAFLVSCGVSVALGEAEAYLGRLLHDAAQDRLAPLYRVAADEGIRVKTNTEPLIAPELDRAPFPRVDPDYLALFLTPRQVSIDASRGCPFVCSFCAVKNAFGRNVRSRDPQTLAAWIAETHDRYGIRLFGFTDDDFVRNPRHLEVLEEIAKIRAGRRFEISLMADVEATCFAEEESDRGARTRQLLELSRRAGVCKVCIGVESTSTAALLEMHKHVNRARGLSGDAARRALLARYRVAFRAWQKIGTRVESSVILGLDADDRGAGVRTARDMIAIGADIVNFNILTPIPGSEDFAHARAEGRLIEEDFNEYFSAPTLRHARLSSEELEAMHREAVDEFYSVRNVARRTARALLGIGRPRTGQPIEFVTRQIGAKLILALGRWSYFQGGLVRVRRESIPRLARSDDDARRLYVGGATQTASVPASMLDDRRMSSLPLLAGHGS